MRHRRFAALLTLVGALVVGSVLAQTGGSNALFWDSGYPKGDSFGKMTASGTYTVQSGWDTEPSGTMTAFFPEDIDSNGDGAGLCYQAPTAFAGDLGGSGGTWSASLGDLPEATYSVIINATFSDGNGNTQGIVRASSAVWGLRRWAGAKKRTPPRLHSVHGEPSCDRWYHCGQWHV
jgi:hypothetical protein